MSVLVRRLVVLLLLTLPARAAAETYHILYSLEAHIAEAGWVFHGSIAQLSREVVVAPGDPSPEGNFSRGVVNYTVTVAVDKVLKGEPPERVQLVRRTDALDKRFEQWQEAKTGFLWFVVRGKDREWRTIRLGDAVPAEAEPHYGTHFLAKSFAPPMFAADLSVLRDPAEILIRATEFARKHGDASEVEDILLPRTLEGRCRPNCSGWIFLPVAPPLEETARRMINAPEEFIPGGGPLDLQTRYDVRTAGLKCLRHFKSDANVALLKRLLEDPTEDPRDGYLKSPIRSQARYQLEAWGVDVPEPE